VKVALGVGVNVVTDVEVRVLEWIGCRVGLCWQANIAMMIRISKDDLK